MLVEQLTVREIDEIISFLQEPYPYQLMDRLQRLRAETMHFECVNKCLQNAPKFTNIVDLFNKKEKTCAIVKIEGV